MPTKHNTRSKNGSIAARKAGIIFPPKRIERYLKEASTHQRVLGEAGVYLAAVLEYLVAEIVELSGNAAKTAEKKERKTISVRHIKLAISNDEEFDKLIGKITIPGGGVKPHIHPELMRGYRGGGFKPVSDRRRKKQVVVNKVENGDEGEDEEEVVEIVQMVA